MSRGLRRALRAGAGPARRLRHRLDGPIVRPLTTDDAPGLRAILEEVLMPVMFDTPSDDGIKQIVVTAEVVEAAASALVIGHAT